MFGLGRLGWLGLLTTSRDTRRDNLETEDGFNLLQENGYFLLLE